MRLVEAVNATVVEAKFFEFINEEGEGPKWGFTYGNWKHDPRPEILLLGSYQHPTTGNNLVGGINLHYLNKQELDDLAKVLPQIMQAGNLYSRYHLGKRLLPGVFDSKYRTYNAAHIQGVERGTIYPKYGFIKTAKDYLKKKVGDLFKPKAQRAKEAEPQYPQDLRGMDQTLNRTMLSLGQEPIPPETPEIKAAQQAVQNYRANQKQSSLDIDNEEDKPLLMATQQFQQQQASKGAIPPHATQPQPQVMQEPPAQLPDLEAERRENQQELMNPENDLDLDDPLQNESIVFYSPRHKRYITEDISTALCSNQN